MSDNIIQLNEDLIKYDLKEIMSALLWKKLSTPCSTKKRISWSMCTDINAPVAVKATVLGVIKGTFRPQPGKWNAMSPSSKAFFLRLPSLNVTPQGILCGRGFDRDVSGRRLRTPCRRYHRSTLGNQSITWNYNQSRVHSGID